MPKALISGEGGHLDPAAPLPPGEHAHLSSARCEVLCGSGDRSLVSRERTHVVGLSEKQDHVPRPTAPALRAHWADPRLPQPHSETQGLHL